MHQYSVGEVVTFIPDMFQRHAAPGGYKIVASMPDRDGDHMYKIKSPLEEHERVIKESVLVKSTLAPTRALRPGVLPEVAALPDQRPNAWFKPLRPVARR